MGCDIHIQLEVRDYETHKWRHVPGPFSCYICNETGRKKDGDPCHWCDGKGFSNYLFHDRRYHLFGILAGVRSDVFPPIVTPRGFPKNLTAELKDAIDDSKDEYFYIGDHSHSWLTLAELEQYDWTRPGVYEGVIGLSDWYEWDGKSPPLHYSGGVSGGGWRTVDQLEAKAIIARSGPPRRNPKPMNDFSRSFDEPSKISVQVEWIQIAKDTGGDILMTAIKKAAWKANVNLPDDIRIVFGFDS